MESQAGAVSRFLGRAFADGSMYLAIVALARTRHVEPHAVFRRARHIRTRLRASNSIVNGYTESRNSQRTAFPVC